MNDEHTVHNVHTYIDIENVRCTCLERSVNSTDLGPSYSMNSAKCRINICASAALVRGVFTPSS